MSLVFLLISYIFRVSGCILLLVNFRTPPNRYFHRFYFFLFLSFCISHLDDMRNLVFFSLLLLAISTHFINNSWFIINWWLTSEETSETGRHSIYPTILHCVRLCNTIINCLLVFFLFSSLLDYYFFFFSFYLFRGIFNFCFVSLPFSSALFQFFSLLTDIQFFFSVFSFLYLYPFSFSQFFTWTFLQFVYFSSLIFYIHLSFFSFPILFSFFLSFAPCLNAFVFIHFPYSHIFYFFFLSLYTFLSSLLNIFSSLSVLLLYYLAFIKCR